MRRLSEHLVEFLPGRRSVTEIVVYKAVIFQAVVFTIMQHQDGRFSNDALPDQCFTFDEFPGSSETGTGHQPGRVAVGIEKHGIGLVIADAQSKAWESPSTAICSESSTADG